jgi:hypothetical protein
MGLLLGNMSKEKICLPRNKSSFINLLHSHKDIAIAKVFLKRDVEIFIFFVGIATVIAWLNKKFNVGIKLLERHNLGRCKWNPSVGRIFCFTEYSNS